MKKTSKKKKAINSKMLCLRFQSNPLQNSHPEHLLTPLLAQLIPWVLH